MPKSTFEQLFSLDHNPDTGIFVRLYSRSRGKNPYVVKGIPTSGPATLHEGASSAPAYIASAGAGAGAAAAANHSDSDSDDSTVFAWPEGDTPEPSVLEWIESSSSSDNEGISVKAAEKLLQQEHSAMLAIRPHANIVKLLDSSYVPPGVFGVALEYGVKGDLAAYLRLAEQPENTCESLRESLRDFMGSFLAGVNHIHESGYVHLDLRSGNIVLNENLQPIIVDFGNATQIDAMGPEDPFSDFYAPPECREDAIIAKTYSDIFAAGVVLFELLSYQVIHKTIHQGLRQTWADGSFYKTTLPEVLAPFEEAEKTDFERSVAALIKRCWSIKPEERPSAATLISELGDGTGFDDDRDSASPSAASSK